MTSMSEEAKRKLSASWTPERRRKNGDLRRGKEFGGNGTAAGCFIDDEGYLFLTQQQGHPLAKPNGTVAEHRRVLYDAIGPGPHSCHWGCGKTDLEWRGPYANRITVDHINGEKMDNRIENLVPACHVCNSARRKSGDPLDWKPGARASHCGKGHEYTPENTALRKSGERAGHAVGTRGRPEEMPPIESLIPGRRNAQVGISTTTRTHT